MSFWKFIRFLYNMFFKMVTLLEELCLLQPLTLHAQLAHQFSHFSNVHFVYPQRKELMLALSMLVRN
jgi:hypothetical protein